MTDGTAHLEIGTRLHFGLLDLGTATGRVYGGCGLALDYPVSEVTWTTATEGGVRVEVPASVDADSLEAIEQSFERLVAKVGQINGVLKVLSTPPQHIGLGVTTALVLGSLHLVNRCRSLGLHRAELEALSGRGGASGIGLAAFFDGGFVVDAGHSRRDFKRFLPSGASPVTSRPVLVGSYPFPESWGIRLFLPDGKRWSGIAEVDFFSENTPVPETEILAGLAATYHAVLPGVCDGDLELLKQGLDALNGTGFKAREIASHGGGVRELLDHLSAATAAAVGMSSMGPLVFLLGPRDILDGAAVSRILKGRGRDLGIAHGRGRLKCDEVGGR